MPKFRQLFSIFSCLSVLVIHSGVSIAQSPQASPQAVAVATPANVDSQPIHHNRKRPRSLLRLRTIGPCRARTRR